MSDLTQEITNIDGRRYEWGEKSKCREICELADIVKVHKLIYTSNKIMWDALSACLKDDKCLSDDLKAKIRRILYAHEVEPYMNLTFNDVDLKLLGLSQINPSDTDLLYEDHRKLKEAFENTLIQLSNKMQKLFNVEAPPENTGLFRWSLEDKVLLEHRNKLVQVQGMYIKNLLDYYKLLEEVLHLRMNDLREMSELKIRECGVELEKYSLQTEILARSNRVTIFTETSHTLEAYRMLIADIKKEQDCCEEEVEKLKLIKEKYKQVACKQYDEILKDYVSHKRDLEMKRLLFKNIKSQ